MRAGKSVRQRTHRLAGVCSALATLFLAAGAQAEGLVESLVRRFTESEFEFLRAKSNAPFLPLAWVTATAYEESEFRIPGNAGPPITFEQTSISQGAFAPIPLGERDALVIGDWIAATRFELHNAPREELDLLSVAVPVGWIRQQSPDWQIAAFVSPLGHHTNEDDWYWETLGGVFARRTASDRVAWIFGAYFDVAPLEDFYTPYVGATFVLNERWSINAVMPWPGVTYAPSPNTYFRFGVVPSGASWSIETDGRRPRMNLTAWDFGLSVQQRLYKSIWLGAEIGVSGIRGLSLVGSDFEEVEVDLDETGYGLVTINFRPGVPE
jgi:hypothetical protein